MHTHNRSCSSSSAASRPCSNAASHLAENLLRHGTVFAEQVSCVCQVLLFVLFVHLSLRLHVIRRSLRGWAVPPPRCADTLSAERAAWCAGTTTAGRGTIVAARTTMTRLLVSGVRRPPAA